MMIFIFQDRKICYFMSKSDFHRCRKMSANIQKIIFTNIILTSVILRWAILNLNLGPLWYLVKLFLHLNTIFTVMQECCFNSNRIFHVWRYEKKLHRVTKRFTDKLKKKEEEGHNLTTPIGHISRTLWKLNIKLRKRISPL